MARLASAMGRLVGVFLLAGFVSAFAWAVAPGGRERAVPPDDPAELVADLSAFEPAAAGAAATVAALESASSQSSPATVDHASFGGEMAGLRIAMPRLRIDLPLELGEIERDTPRDSYAGATPEHAAFVLPGSALLGRGGNTYVYAHARPGMFLALWQARIGDEVVVYGNGAERRYRLAVIAAQVSPGDISWLDPGAPERVTLQTSTGPRPEDPRFLAVAYPDGGR